MMHYVLDARTATDHFPGIGRYVSQLAQAIVPQLADNEQLVLLHDPTQPSRWQLPLTADNVQTIATAVSPFSLAQQWQIPRLLRQIQANVYHSPYYLMPYRLPLPTIVTIYDITPQLFPHYVSSRARLLFRLTSQLAMRRARHIISISQATSHDLQHHYPFAAPRIATVHLAPDHHFRPQNPAEIARIRQQFGLSGKYVLYFGINKPHKNLVNLLRAWQKLAPSTANTTLVIAGAWDNRYPQAKAEAEMLGLQECVRFLGPIDSADLPPLYSGADVFVFPSRYEGFGLPVVEAMACGTAVTCAHTSSLPEVGGEAVLYFDPNNIEEMAAQIGRLLTDEPLRQELAQRGLAQARHFSPQKTAAQTLTLYRNAAHK
ncbi:MAG: glycosyltransferase family 4 protein [Ardenticatenaceae bacterium]|nr:glycosyltransferase family 4 protein [Ardenticatenaceae bacterium]